MCLAPFSTTVRSVTSCCVGDGQVVREALEVQEERGIRFVGKHYFHNATSTKDTIKYGIMK